MRLATKKARSAIAAMFVATVIAAPREVNGCANVMGQLNNLMLHEVIQRVVNGRRSLTSYLNGALHVLVELKLIVTECASLFQVGAQVNVSDIPAVAVGGNHAEH